jgi:hypothetical protein
VSFICTANFSWKRFRRNLLDLADTQHVLQRAAHEEVLLFEAQLLAPDLLVVGIENLGEILAGHFWLTAP